MFIVTEYYELLNVRLYNKIMNEICSEFTNSKME